MKSELLQELRNHAEHTFALMEASQDCLDRYWQLAIDTEKSILASRSSAAACPFTWFQFHDSCFVLPWLLRANLGAEEPKLRARWNEWGQEYDEILARSPKLRLKNMISEVSETHTLTSWPSGWEQDVWEWALSYGKGTDCPFDDRKNILDDAFHREINRLVLECGGFLYRCDEIEDIKFDPAAKLPAVWRSIDHNAAIARDRPFGFLNDMGRPNWQKFAPEAVTSEETAWRSEMSRRKHSQLSRWQRLRLRFRAK